MGPAYKTKLGRPLLSIALGMAGAIIAFAPGCNAVTNTTAIQCTSEAECLRPPGTQSLRGLASRRKSCAVPHESGASDP